MSVPTKPGEREDRQKGREGNKIEYGRGRERWTERRRGMTKQTRREKVRGRGKGERNKERKRGREIEGKLRKELREELRENIGGGKGKGDREEERVEGGRKRQTERGRREKTDQ